MNKRNFVAASVGMAGLWATSRASAASTSGNAAAAAKASGTGPALLTISGAITQTNRGALDTAIDQMMGKQGIQFASAYALDAAALQRMAAVTIQPTLEYDAKRHTLRGPLLTTVLATAGVSSPASGAASVQLLLRAVDGYAASVTLADVQAWRMIVATHIDGQPMALGGLGPQWAVYDADAIPAFKDKTLKERFAQCPWGLYHVEVQKG